MVAIAGVLILAGYSALLWGYILVKGYNITAKQLFSITWPPPATA